MSLGSRSCLGAGAALPRVKPALTKVTVRKLSSSARWQLPSVREESQSELFHFNPTGFLSWRPPSRGLPGWPPGILALLHPPHARHPPVSHHHLGGQARNRFQLAGRAAQVASLWFAVSSSAGGEIQWVCLCIGFSDMWTHNFQYFVPNVLTNIKVPEMPSVCKPPCRP